VAAAPEALGLGGGGLMHGIGRRGADGALNRARGIALACGPTGGRGTDAESGSNPSSTPARSQGAPGREEADDGWPPPVSDRRRRSRGAVEAGRAGPGSARLGCGGLGRRRQQADAGEELRGRRRTSRCWAAKTQRRRRAASGTELEEQGWAKGRERERREGENLFKF
jgi:hypothetical protein